MRVPRALLAGDVRVRSKRDLILAFRARPGVLWMSGGPTPGGADRRLQEDDLDIDLSQPRPGVVVMAVRGRLNMTTAPVFLERMAEVCQAGRRDVIVDLGEVDLVDSSGIGALISSTRQVRQQGGDLRLARPNRRMQVLLDVTYLHDMFRTYDDLDKAITDS